MEHKADTTTFAWSRMFEKGASDALMGAGMSEDCAKKVASAIVKAADSDDESFWDRNKGWIIPTLIGAGAFVLGDNVGKYGRRDRNAFENAVDVLFRRVRNGSGIRKDSPLQAFSTKDLPLPGDSRAHGVKTLV